MTYLLDTNVFIQAKNLGFAFDVCPGFWDWIVLARADGRVLSVDRVGQELRGREDDLRDWADAQGPALFAPPDASVFEALAKVSTWVTSQNYRASAVNEFLQAADYFLIGHALAYGHIVVTHERPGNQITLIKIPNVCAGVGVSTTTPLDMLRRERVRFVLDRG